MYGIVLEGGGARGAYQIGVWKALRELGVEFDAVAGTSVGALNGAMMIQDDFGKALEIWTEITPSKVINLDESVYEEIKNYDFTFKNGQNILKQVKLIIKEGGLDISPLRQLLNQYIDENRIRKSGKLFGIVAASLPDLSHSEFFLEDIPEGKLIDYLIASANLPVFKLDRLDGKLFLDGGFYNNLPINMLEAKGYKNIIAVRLNSFSLKKKVNEDELNLIYLKPSESLGALLDFSNKKAQRNILVGYYDAQRVFKKYKGRKYYLEIDKPEDYFFNLFLRLEGGKLDRFFAEFNIPSPLSQRRYIFEKLVPMLADLLGVKEGSYEDIALALLERTAEKMGIERLRVFKWDELYDQVVKIYSSSQNDSVFKRIIQLLPNDFMLKTAKAQVLDRIAELLFGIP
ncbi:MAG TPA: patatin-like phospholipase family protein [Clostridia bacterium]|nr:patatin-like phospholipase family protein [Clostridia bacterium]